jgi:hypothetical protein
MAGELQVRYGVTGRTVRFVLWNTAGQVWNGSSFVAYVTANLNTYAIASSEQGTASGRYVGDMPAVAAGSYTVEAFDRAGGSLAETDALVGEGDIDWTGTAVASSVGMLDLTDGIESGVTPRQATRAMAAALAGKVTSSGGAYAAIGNASTPRLAVTDDGGGNRTVTPTL